MRIIVPMAGMGKRLRPHTLTNPKPLFPIAGKPIVQRLVEDIAAIYRNKIDEIVYICGQFGEAVERDLLQVAQAVGSVGRIVYQDQPLGTAHAIAQAGDSLNDELIIAFADTLFTADFQLDRSKDGAIWVHKVANPKQFGVVTLDGEGHINGMVEKPEQFVSDLAIIGIYYIRDGRRLRTAIQHLLDNKIMGKGEYQLTDALENLRQEGARFAAAPVTRWMDCGNKDSVLDTNRQILDLLPTGAKPQGKQVTVIEPCYIGEGAVLENAIIGPHVSVGRGAVVRNSIARNCIFFDNANVVDVVVQDSIVGQAATLQHAPVCVNLGDYSNG